MSDSEGNVGDLSPLANAPQQKGRRLGGRRLAKKDEDELPDMFGRLGLGDEKKLPDSIYEETDYDTLLEKRRKALKEKKSTEQQKRSLKKKEDSDSEPEGVGDLPDFF